MKKLFALILITLVIDANTHQIIFTDLDATQDEEQTEHIMPEETEKPEYPIPEGMVQITGGAFLMGSPTGETGRLSSEGPQHRVKISTFYMGKYPVTQAEYQKIMGTNPSHFKGHNLPVEQVSWFDAILYCNKLSQKEGLTQAYTINGNIVSWNRDADGYRLPTEAEWEYACRAGTQTPYYSGASVNTAGWHSGNSGGRTHTVGEKQPNPWGLYDMHGNVLEWCWDLFGNYTNEEQENPLGANEGTHRVYRGGSWHFGSHLLRSAYRFGNKPTIQVYFLGFRVVRNIVFLELFREI